MVLSQKQLPAQLERDSKSGQQRAGSNYPHGSVEQARGKGSDDFGDCEFNQ